MRRLLVAVALVLGLTACASEQDPGLMPGPPDVQVDTPELRKVKARIGMEDCPTGTAASLRAAVGPVGGCSRCRARWAAPP